MEKIVAKLAGTREDVPDFEDLRTGEFDGVMAWIITSGTPVPLPKYDGFPYIGHLHLPNIRKILDEWSDDQFDEYDTEQQSMIEGMLDVFKKAVDAEKDVISFYY